MSDKARELAGKIGKRFARKVHIAKGPVCEVPFIPPQYIDEAVSLIDSALQSARLEAIEECKKAMHNLESDEIIADCDVDWTLDALKEAPDADAE
jgi:hypothetical protein